MVDDKPENLLAIGAVLEGLGEEIVTARSGVEALRKLLEDDYAAILLDVMMPGMDGFETAALIRERERSRNTPILFLTAISKSDHHVFRGYEVGAVDYLFKPIVPQVLRSKVTVFVELSRQRQLLKKHAELLEAQNNELERAMASQRRAEEEIRRLNAHLERRLMELTETNRELDAFSYSVSHDLRAPLRRIEGFSRALLESAAPKLDEQEQRYLNSLGGNSRRMLQLIDDLLKLSRLTRQEFSRGSVDLSALARGIASDLAAHQPDRRVRFVIEDGVTVSGDARLLGIALSNLLENAWKFTARSGEPCIEFGRAPSPPAAEAAQPSPAGTFFVRDNGVGFEMAEAERLFSPFQRLHPEKDFEGTGIGLATVRRIIHRHGGRSWAEAAPGRGATFFFQLPPIPAEEAEVWQRS